jgi:hypothetical protein
MDCGVQGEDRFHGLVESEMRNLRCPLEIRA